MSDDGSPHRSQQAPPTAALEAENARLRAEVGALRTFCQYSIRSAQRGLREWAQREGLAVDRSRAEARGPGHPDAQLVSPTKAPVMPVAPADRRRFERVRVDLPASFCTAADACGTEAALYDISIGGLFIRTGSNTPPIGTRVACGFFVQLMGRRETVKVVGRVVRDAPRDPLGVAGPGRGSVPPNSAEQTRSGGFALAFERLDIEQQQVIAALVTAATDEDGAFDGDDPTEIDGEDFDEMTTPGGWWSESTLPRWPPLRPLL